MTQSQGGRGSNKNPGRIILSTIQPVQCDATHALVKIPAAKPFLFQEVKGFSQQQIASLRAQSTKECPCFSVDRKVQFWELFLRYGFLLVEDVFIVEVVFILTVSLPVAQR